ncbi:MAG: hypothetical protein ACJASX_002962 [Limisphaerales bacterium]|jgi:hypothetical protein
MDLLNANPNSRDAAVEISRKDHKEHLAKARGRILLSNDPTSGLENSLPSIFPVSALFAVN